MIVDFSLYLYMFLEVWRTEGDTGTPTKIQGTFIWNPIIVRKLSYQLHFCVKTQLKIKNLQCWSASNQQTENNGAFVARTTEATLKAGLKHFSVE